MRHETIVFQLATHYLPKIALRLECLFLTIEQACNEVHPVIHHYALKNVLDVMKLIEKPELKSRFLKEFMRIEHTVHKSQTALSEKLYAELLLQIQLLNHVAGRFGETIHQDSFLQSMQLIHASHDRDGELYSPQLLVWLENHEHARQQDLSGWMQHLQTLSRTVSVYLGLLRNTAIFEAIDMLNGFYQCPLPSKHSCHLILLRMDKHCGIVPKMQLGHHGLSLRLCEAHSMSELRKADTKVDLAICQL